MPSSLRNESLARPSLPAGASVSLASGVDPRTSSRRSMRWPRHWRHRDQRDRRGGTAKRERDLLRESGLLALSIPADEGGWGASWATTLQAVRRLARVDGSLAHLFGFHHLLLATTRLFGDAWQWQEAYAGTVAERWFWGNALNPLDTRTAIRPDDELTWSTATRPSARARATPIG